MALKDKIEDLQKYLNDNGANPKLDVDGRIGTLTIDATKARQKVEILAQSSSPPASGAVSKVMKRVAARGVTTPLIDISHYDEVIDFAKVKAAGYAAVIMKATEGLSNVDKYHAKNRVAAKKAGLLFGSYHFFHPDLNPIRQISHFLDVVGPNQPGELRHMLDLEETKDGGSAQQIRAAAIAALNELESRAGHVPILYTAPYYADGLNLPDYFTKYPLFIAHYGTSAPKVPRPWMDWDVWQYTDKGDVPGIPAPDEDLDVFNGTFEELKKKLVA